LLNGIQATDGLNDLKVKGIDLHLCGADERCNRLIAELDSDIEYLRVAVPQILTEPIDSSKILSALCHHGPHSTDHTFHH